MDQFLIYSSHTIQHYRDLITVAFVHMPLSVRPKFRIIGLGLQAYS